MATDLLALTFPDTDFFTLIWDVHWYFFADQETAHRANAAGIEINREYAMMNAVAHTVNGTNDRRKV